MPTHRRVILAVSGLLLLVGALVGCGPHFGASTPAASPPPPVHQVIAGGRTLAVVGVFSTDKTRQQGLQHRTITPDQAVVFTWGGQTSTTTFWMVNTPQPLDVLWVRSGRAVGVATMTPCLLSCPSYTPPGAYDTAVEALGGTFAAVRPGDPVAFR